MANMMHIQDNEVVLFQGDGVTDHGRDRDNPTDLGGGYALMTAAWFSALYPQKRVTFINRGMMGNRVKDLRERWDADCNILAPTWVSILVGILNTKRREASFWVLDGVLVTPAGAALIAQSWLKAVGAL